MLISRIQQKFKMTSTALNNLCRSEKKYPIFLHTDYFVDENAVVYILDVSNEEPNFIPLIPTSYSKSHNIPRYKIKNDLTNDYDKLRADIIYLSTFYGPMPKEMIVYYPSFDWNNRVMDDIRYRTTFIKRIDENTISFYDEIMKRIIISGKTSNYYISNKGTVYNLTTNTFTKHYFNAKLYHSISIPLDIFNYQTIHRLVYCVWNNNGNLPKKGNSIDHIDGFKNHNWNSNLREVTNLENFRSAAYDQNLRNTPWSYEIVHYVCKLMSDINTTGIREMYDKTIEKYKDFNVSYSAFKHKVYEIMNGEFWKDVASKYNVTAYKENFNNHIHAPTDDELIHKICQIATNGIKYENNKQMAEENNLPVHIVNRVLRGEYRTDISSQYNIQYSTKKRRGFTEDEVHTICQDFMDGYAVNRIVERRGRNKCDIWKIIRREKYSKIGKQYNFESVRPDLLYAVPYDPS